MNSIVIDIDGQRSEIEIPSSYSEMTGEQLILAARYLADQKDTAPLLKIAGIDDDLAGLLSPYQKYSIMETLEWITDLSLSALDFMEWKIGSLMVDGEEYFGPTSNFGNVTWGEFVYVDQCLLNKHGKASVAAMFRPKREGYNGETDIRIPFTACGTANRFSRFDNVPESDILAVMINYKAMRHAALESVYTEIFPYQEEQPEDETDESAQDETPSVFSWMNVHRSILGDNIQDEKTYLELPVHTVLHRLNERIRDSRRQKTVKPE